MVEGRGRGGAIIDGGNVECGICEQGGFRGQSYRVENGLHLPCDPDDETWLTSIL
jgi:hypothetical protein